VYHASLRMEKPFFRLGLHCSVLCLGRLQRHSILCNLDVLFSSSRPNIRYQEVQHHSTTTTSLYFIPCVVSGALTNIAAGLLVSKVKANHLALAGAICSTVAPVILANMDIKWSYWRAAFWAMTLVPLSADGMSYLV